MNETEVVALMESATSAADWDQKADEVKRRCGGYPTFWFPAIMISGLAGRVAARWGGDADIHIHSVGR